MRMYPRDFPPDRRKDPKRRAERHVYEALAGCGRPGFVYYEWRKGYERIELDFAVWIEDLGRFALQVKGGHYLFVDGDWRLKKREGVQPIRTCPLDEAKLGALDLHDDIQERACIPYNPFVIPVLVFPDMTEPDEDIENLARRKGVYVIWGVENPAGRSGADRPEPQGVRPAGHGTDRRRGPGRDRRADPAGPSRGGGDRKRVGATSGPVPVGGSTNPIAGQGHRDGPAAGNPHRHWDVPKGESQMLTVRVTAPWPTRSGTPVAPMATGFIFGSVGCAAYSRATASQPAQQPGREPT